MNKATPKDIALLDAEDVLMDKALLEYKRGMEMFYDQLISLNVNIYIVEQIVEFPFELFVAPGETTFFRQVVSNFGEASLLIISRLASDTNQDSHTLSQFRNWVLEQVKPEHRLAFQERLKRSRFDKEIRAMLKKAKLLRDRSIAHLTKAPLPEDFSKGIRLDLPEIKSLRDALNGQLEALSFNTEHMMLPIDYHPRVQYPVGSNHRPDIEKLLDSLVRDSGLLDMAEREPEQWHYRRPHLNETQVEQLNQYRRKFGLTEI